MNDSCPACGSATVSERLRGLCGHCLASALMDPANADGRFAVPGHEVKEEIARGGMGIVYRAQQLRPPREVALKMLLPQGATEAQRERFLIEARALASLDHPGLLPVYQSGESSGIPFFTMKLARGGTLAERRAEYRGAWRGIAELIAELAEAVQFAHGHGVLHRDLKPGNVLFDTDGAEGSSRAYVADFGLAKVAEDVSDLTKSIAMLGSPHYVAPEVAERGAAAASTASDVYALGAMLYELLAQQRPFEAETIPALLRQIVEKEAPPIPGCPRDLLIIARKALAKAPASRYESARAFADDLRRWLTGQPVKARAASGAEHLWSWARRQPALAAVILLFTASLVAGGFVLIGKNRALSRGLADEQLARATALQQSGDISHRDAALGLLRDSVRGGAGPDAARTAAITLLATPGWRELRRVPWPDGVPASAAPDFSVLAQVHKGTLRLRPLLSGADEEISCPSPPEKVTGVFTGPRRVAVRFAGGTHRLYHCEEKAWTHEWHGIVRILFSSDGRWMARTAKDSRDVTIEDLTGGHPPRILSSMHAEPRPLALTPDGSRLALTGANNARVEVLEVKSGRRIVSVGHPWRHELPLKVAWRPDGEALAVATDVTDAFVWLIGGEKHTWQRRIRGHHMELTAVAWHPSGEWLATASFDDTVRVWEAVSGRELLRLPAESSLVAFNPDGNAMLCTDDDKREFVVSRFSAPKVARQVQLHHESPDASRQRGPFGLALTPDGRCAVVAGDNTWLVETATGAMRVRCDTGYTFDACIAGGKTLYTGTQDGILRSTMAETADETWTMSPMETFIRRPGNLRTSWSETTESLAVSFRDRVQLYRSDNGATPVREWMTGEVSINPVALSPDGRWIVAGTDGERSDKSPLIFDTSAAGDAVCAMLPLSGLVYPVFSPDSRTLYTVSPEGLAAWQTGTWRRVWLQLPGSGHAAFERIAMSGDGRLLAVTVVPHSIQLFAAATGAPLAILDHPGRHRLEWIALDHRGTVLAASGALHAVQFWDLVRLRAALKDMGLAWTDPE